MGIFKKKGCRLNTFECSCMQCMHMQIKCLIWLLKKGKGWTFPPPFKSHIPLIKRSVQTSVLQCATNTRRRTEPTCVEEEEEEEETHFRFNLLKTINGRLDLLHRAHWVTRVGHRPSEQWLPNSLCQKKLNVCVWGGGLCNQTKKTKKKTWLRFTTMRRERKQQCNFKSGDV